MTTIPHTPPPWTFRADGEANHYTLIGPDGRWLISFLHNGEQLTAKQEANVRVMAAGPGMLAELKACEDALLAALPHAPRIRDILKARLDGVRAAITAAETMVR